MLQRIRYAISHENFSKPLKNIVEVDETYFGGRRKGAQGRGTVNKVPIVGAAERGGEVRCKITEDTKLATLKPVIKSLVEEGAILVTDQYCAYNSASKWGYTHKVINHYKKKYVDGDIYTNTIEGFWSHLKRGLKPFKFMFPKSILASIVRSMNFVIITENKMILRDSRLGLTYAKED
ncbi:MAG: IS1595 family transposase [Verrucomicrobiia bacterium]